MSGIRPSKLWPEFVALAALETDDCVLWPHGGSAAGYGQVQKFGVKVYTHREALLSRQPAPAGMETAHSCRNRNCMNYRHLRWATPAENQLDRVRDGTDNRGERHGLARHTNAEVLAIKAELAAGQRNIDIAQRFGVDRHWVAKIKTGQIWTHV